jgi:hypothetical protein
MKKILLLVAVMLFAASSAFAQFSLGGRAAANFGTIYGDDADDAPWGLGFAAGVSAKIGINPMIGIVPDLDINLRRVADDEATWTVWALEVPVMVRFNATSQLFLEAGPMLSFLLSGKYDLDEGEDVDYGKYLNTVEFGLSFGAGFSIMPKLDINARFNLGLTSELEEVDMGLAKAEIDKKNMQFQVGATYWFM